MATQSLNAPFTEAVPTAGTTSRSFTALLSTSDHWHLTVLRLTLGLVIFPHGAQKLFGWFGGYGFEGTMGYFGSLGIPYVFGLLAIAAETAGGLALIGGFLTRIAAAGVGGVMVVAAFITHLANGFFMNWSGQQAGEGFEYHILALAMAVALVIGGGGRLSVDRALTRNAE